MNFAARCSVEEYMLKYIFTGGSRRFWVCFRLTDLLIHKNFEIWTLYCLFPWEIFDFPGFIVALFPACRSGRVNGCHEIGAVVQKFAFIPESTDSLMVFNSVSQSENGHLFFWPIRAHIHFMTWIAKKIFTIEKIEGIYFCSNFDFQ